MTVRVILIDRDGVINANRDNYVKDPAELVLLPNSGRALSRLRASGFRVLVVTNQAGIAKGLFSLPQLQEVHARLRSLVEAEGGGIDAFYVCPHHPKDGCDCRKPAPGLILSAMREWGFEAGETYLVGDNWRDIEAARAAGCRPALVRCGVHGQREKPDPSVPDFPDLMAFVDFLLGRES